ncbi:MAG: Acetyltransferase [Actinomycetia bacterium]|nr:Acetyltransferase [Actinomycetes bacterium]
MVEVVESDAPSPSELLAIQALVDAATAADHTSALSDDHRLALRRGDPAEGTRLVARDGREVVGFAQLLRGNDVRSLELVVDPDHRALVVDDALTEAALQRAAAWGPGRVRMLVAAVRSEDDARLARFGFEPERDVLQLRVPLPLHVEARWPAGVELRTFEPGVDEDAWLTVNNRAFATHPEQGGWVRATLDAHMAEPWFDPKGFLMAFDHQGLAGFCWTKIHADEGLGEIYVIGVDPGRQGLGLGRALVVAGLQHMAELDVPTGMLYVEGDNDAALGLYRSLGFTEHQRDRWYITEVAP